ncbi:MAG: bifunctional adenosylcobinamide kinase/adenosylcobinamide-phosphate guanylyltransferase [Gammaproteobacteria bacterium]
MLTLILGGARSGKSRYAEQCALTSGKNVFYIATAIAGDAEMQARIERHKADRPGHWQTLEEPIGLGRLLSEQASKERCLLVDCLTLWLSNILFDADGNIQEALFRQELSALQACVVDIPGEVILVSNEVGSGVIPMGSGTRRYVDEAGRLHQQLAQVSDRVVLVTAGIPQILK